MAGALKRFVPLFDRILVKKAEALTKTKAGIIIPEKAQEKVLTGKVIAVGTGLRTESGSIIPPAVAVGDEVLLPEYGGTKVKLDNEDFLLLRDSDLIGKFKA